MMSISINWADASVQAAIIQAVGGVLAAAIAALAAAIVGKQFANRRKLEARLSVALKDIRYLLAVEEEHCKQYAQPTPETNRRRVRHAVTGKGLHWSGKFTPARITDLASKLPSPSQN